MSDIAAVYEDTRKSISDLVRSLPETDLHKEVPATPGWSIKDVIAHLAGDLTYALADNFPQAFFTNFGSPEGVAVLNDWTQNMVEERKDRSLDELIEEWDAAAEIITAMMRGEKEWPSNVIAFGDRVLLTDIGVHQQDIYGALGIQRDRDGAPVKIGTSGYVAMAGWRLGDLPPLRFQMETKAYVAGEGEPGATVTASRFEFFRSLSGRRSEDQVRGYDWAGDPEPYLHLFFPYGPRTIPLHE